MTLMYKQTTNINGPRMHAFVIGVGAYPHAKPDRGVLKDLRAVDDLPSAADSAKLMFDWLLANESQFVAKLASLEVLISDPANTDNRYVWAEQAKVDEATSANVESAGEAWLKRVTTRPGDTAFFYCCGHGAVYGGQPVLLLGDLNLKAANPWAHLNLGTLAQSLRRTNGLGCAFMFSDACGEFVTRLELSSAQDCRFFPAPLPFDKTLNNVSFLCAASEAQLAHDAAAPGFEGIANDGTGVRFGRFTQTVLKGLQGSSARWSRNGWYVDPLTLFQDLKKLKQIYFQNWKERPFDPYYAATPGDFYPIIRHHNAELPLVIMTDPETRITDYDLHICQTNDKESPYLESRPTREREAWRLSVPASRDALYAVAVNSEGRHATPFIPSQPVFDHVVTVT